MKICSKCKQSKSTDEFNKNRSKHDGLNSFCRECARQKAREYYHSGYYNKRVWQESRKKRVDANNAYLESLSLRCEKCGEDHPAVIDFHHADPAEKEIKISQARHNGWSIERLQREIDKCMILCANCHRKLHWGSTALFGRTNGPASGEAT